MSEHYDDLETRSADEREAGIFGRLPGFIETAKQKAPGWANRLDGVDASAVTSREALASLPVLRKSELKDAQAEEPPFGGFIAADPDKLGRIFMSPGPIFEPQGTEPDPWRGARTFYAAGFRPGDVVHNSFAYHLTPGGFILDSGAQALGCSVFPAGIGNTEMQAEAIELLKPVGFTGTPDYLKVLLDKAEEIGKDVSSIKRALVGGGALFPALRQEYAERGVATVQCYATADVGVISYESSALEGMIIDEGCIVEIVKPGTCEPVADGDVGEVVVTTFNPVYPMIRFGTGDLSAVLPGVSPCGRTNMRIKGWMGRADQTTKIKGMFVHPSQVAEIGKRHADIGRLRLVVSRDGAQDGMVLQVESADASDGLADALKATLKDVTKLNGSVEFAAEGALPNDGMVIDDQRDYSK
ncbi:MAG: phenylacetate--CoA ligase [Alphaproteobacteria bacterium]|nr:phenylacetate--CoA ligase [Alphaproteobacteria bacterium]